MANPVTKHAPSVIRLSKGELLFKEGEMSRSMYLVQKGMIRIFKAKGDSKIEIDTIRSGQILGELAFLDGLARSASAEALTEVELVEISGPTFVKTLGTMPDWLKLMLKTVVGRLRTTSTRVRQLEQASSEYDYSKKGAGKSSSYVFMNSHDVLKALSGILLAASRTRRKSADEKGVEVNLLTIHRYANSVIGIPVAKVTALLDVLEQLSFVKQRHDDATGEDWVSVYDLDFFEKFIAFSNEENQKEKSKQRTASIKGFMIMSLILKHMNSFEKDPRSGQTAANIQFVIDAETKDGKAPFRLDEFVELANQGFCEPLQVRNSKEAISLLDPNEFTLQYRFQRLFKAISAMNEERK